MTVLVANETSEFIVSEHVAVLKFLVAKKNTHSTLFTHISRCRDSSVEQLQSIGVPEEDWDTRGRRHVRGASELLRVG